jgi:hypothetical protein
VNDGGGRLGGLTPPNLPHPSPPRRSRAAAHHALGIQLGTLGDEVVDAVELAVVSRPYEGRPAGLRRVARRRRHTRSDAAVREGGGGGRSGGRRGDRGGVEGPPRGPGGGGGGGGGGAVAAGVEGRGRGCRGLLAVGGAALTGLVAFTFNPSSTRRVRVARLPSLAALIRAISACGRSHWPSARRRSIFFCCKGARRLRREASRGARLTGATQMHRMVRGVAKAGDQETVRLERVRQVLMRGVSAVGERMPQRVKKQCGGTPDQQARWVR